MLQRSTLDFLKKLKQNNNREWFEKNKPVYNVAKKEFEEFISAIIAGISSFDPAVKHLEAKKCLFRINRDVRFAKDKSPYKSNFGAIISPGGKKSFSAGYYIHLEPGNSFFAGGVYMPPAPELHAIRQEIDYNTKEFQKIILEKNFKKHFGKLDESDKLKTAPKGYAKDHPAIEILKNKSYIVVNEVQDDQILKADLLKYSLKVFKTLYPFDAFLRRALD